MSTEILPNLASPSSEPPDHLTRFNTWFNSHQQPVAAQTLADLFETQVSATPNACALLYQQQTLGYDELNRRANQLAHYLRSLGIGAEQVVGLALPRSFEMIIGLLAILKTGAAYLPLDPNYPQPRLDFMLADAKPVRVLTLAAIAPALLPTQAALALPLDRFDGSAWPDGNLTDAERVAPASPNQLAYLIYTSGSTGQPKGVMLTHHGIANLVLNQRQQFGLDADARILQFASISFDAALAEIALALCSGVTLVLAPAARLMPGQDLADLVSETGVTVVTLPPSALAVMPPHSLPSVRTLVVAGEACPQHLVAPWSTGRRMINAYGPTEVTVCATISAPLHGEVTPPLGQPMANVQLYLLDQDMKPVPPGVAGEVYLASPGLARGYLGLPELTRQKFIPNPFAANPPQANNDRLYRTGDLASWHLDGSLQFLGRIDHQIKLRGFRVEPGEIEGTLLRHPAVAQAVVLSRPDAHGQPQLIAWVVLRQDAAPEFPPGQAVGPLLGWLAEQLPHYLVPAALLVLPTLPLSPNGKLDRNALPAPDWHAPRTDPAVPNGGGDGKGAHEQVVTQLFCEILGLPQVAPESSFFNLGGHSLSASRLISQIKATLGVHLNLDDVFRYPSVATLTPFLSQAQHQDAAPRPRLQLRRRVQA